ncbi:formyltransferase family protein, partial [Klebsiella variicola]
MSQIIIISKKKWDNSNYNLLKNNKEFILLDNINLKKINQVNPRIIFFIFWSKIIPKKVFSNFLCIQFHSSDLPKFKGGSPIQNQILKKIYKTKISAFKINNKIDSGDICMKSNISLTGK